MTQVHYGATVECFHEVPYEVVRVKKYVVYFSMNGNISYRVLQFQIDLQIEYRGKSKLIHQSCSSACRTVICAASSSVCLTV